MPLAVRNGWTASRMKLPSVTGVVDAAPIDLALAHLAEIGEPESALAIEDDVVGPLERTAVAGVVENLDGSGVEVDPLDASVHVVVGLPDRSAVAVRLHLPLESAVVADVALAVGTDGRAVGAAAGLGHDLLAAVGEYPGEGAAGDLDHEHGAVRHRDRSFGKEQAIGDRAVVHRLMLLGIFEAQSLLRSRRVLSESLLGTRASRPRFQQPGVRARGSCTPAHASSRRPDRGTAFLLGAWPVPDSTGLGSCPAGRFHSSSRKLESNKSIP